MNEKHAGWITHVMEYDIEIKVTKLVHRKGLCEQLASSQEVDASNENEVVLVLQNGQERVNDNVYIPCWTQNMIHFLKIGLCPPEMSKAKRRYFRLQATPYVLVYGVLFKKVNGVLQRCIGTCQFEKLL